MKHNKCLTGKTFKGYQNTSAYGNAHGVEKKDGVEKEVNVDYAETFCGEHEIRFGEKLSCNSWVLTGTHKNKDGEFSLKGVARLDKDGVIRMAYCGDIAYPLDIGFVFATTFFNQEGYLDKQGNLKLKGKGMSHLTDFNVNIDGAEYVLNLCMNVVSSSLLKRKCN